MLTWNKIPLIKKNLEFKKKQKTSIDEEVKVTTDEMVLEPKIKVDLEPKNKFI